MPVSSMSCSCPSTRSPRRPRGRARSSPNSNDRTGENPGGWMTKNFMLDTNVLLHDPTALFKFRDNRIIIPITVIEELDRFKKDLNMLGRNARTVSKYIDRMREEGRLAEGGGLRERPRGHRGALPGLPRGPGRQGVDRRVLRRGGERRPARRGRA